MKTGIFCIQPDKKSDPAIVARTRIMSCTGIPSSQPGRIVNTAVSAPDIAEIQNTVYSAPNARHKDGTIVLRIFNQVRFDVRHPSVPNVAVP